MGAEALRIDGTHDALYTFVLAHGAGAGMDSPFLASFAAALASRSATVGGIRVVRFEFPYMMRARARGVRQLPDAMPALLERYREVVHDLGVESARLLVGGKSLGGRVASHLVETTPAAGLVCLGYPFHPPRNRERLRIKHLRASTVPTLICQGTRDPFGSAEDVAAYSLPASLRIVWLPDGDHDFVPRKRSGRTASDNVGAAIDAVLAFIGGLDPEGGLPEPAPAVKL